MTSPADLADPGLVAGPSSSEPHRRVDDRLLIMCGLAWAAGLIHVQAALGHLDSNPLHAVFLELVAVAQLAWGVVIYRSPRPRLLGAGAVVSLMVVAVWIVSRTSGVPIGPEWRPEPVGAADLLASVDELLLAVLVLAALRGAGWSRRRAPRVAMRMVAGLSLYAVLTSSLVIVVGAHAH